MRNSESYASPPLSVNAAVPLTTTEDQEQIDSGTLAAVGSDASTCFFCGNSNHPRSRCPARDAVCSKCQKKGILQKFAVRRRSERTKFRLQPGLPHLPQWVPLNPCQSLWELLLSKVWKSKPYLTVAALKVLFTQGWWRRPLSPFILRLVQYPWLPQCLVQSVSLVRVPLTSPTKDVNMQVTVCPSCLDFVLT